MAVFRIFDNVPQKGMPISLRGFTEGIRRMAKAWETLSVVGGVLEWYNGEPVITITGEAGESLGENLHSFHFTQTDAAEGSIASGRVWIGATETTIIDFPVGTVDCTTNTKFYIKVDWASDNAAPTVTWVEGTAYPTETYYVDIFPVLEFTAGAAGTCKERQQSDIHTSPIRMPDPDESDYKVLQIQSGAFVLDWPRAH